MKINKNEEKQHIMLKYSKFNIIDDQYENNPERSRGNFMSGQT